MVSVFFKEVANKYSFVILDITLKLFMLVYTLSSNHFLSKSDFNEVSFFRTTLAMIVGLTATALGYYIFNFYHSSKKIKNEFSVLIGLVAAIPLCGILITGVLFFLYPEIIGIDKVTSISPLFLFLICLASILSQVLIYIVKVVGGLEKVVNKYFIINSLLIVATASLFSLNIVNSQYYILLAFYSVNAALCVYIVNKSGEMLNIMGSFSHKLNPFDNKFKQFFIPNFLESLLSVPRTWLSFTVFIYVIGFDYIGEILLIQMVLGLFIFVCNSFILNTYISINCTDITTRTNSLQSGLKPIVVLSIIMVLITITCWDLIKISLNISQISDTQILILCSATIIQAALLPLGTIFKKSGLSNLTLYHNILFLVTFISSEYFLLLNFGEIGYYWAYSLSWGVVLVTMIYQAAKYKVCSPNKMVFILTIILLSYSLMYLIFVKGLS